MPEKPRERPILEPEYDLDTERPAKVRRITPREYGNTVTGFVCPGCGANSVTRFGLDDVMCRLCGQHTHCEIQVADSKLTVVFTAFECRKWRDKTPEDYRKACEACPKHNGPYQDHTECGCFKEFECVCE